MPIEIDLRQLALLAIASASIHWLVARSEIMRPLWSRARGKLAELLACAGCSGFWLGVLLGLAGVRPVRGAGLWAACVGAGLLSLFVTPVTEAVLLWGLERSAMPADDHDLPGA